MTKHKQVLGTQYDALRQIGYALDFFISTNHTQPSRIHKVAQKTFSRIPSFSLKQTRSIYSFKKIGRDCPVVPKVSYRVLHLDFQTSACSHDTQSTQKSPFPCPDSPETVRRVLMYPSLRYQKSQPHSQLEVEVSNTSGDWILLNSTLKTLKSVCWWECKVAQPLWKLVWQFLMR